MISISILYPLQSDAFFDVNYYLQQHMPMSVKLLSAHHGYKGVMVEQGESGVSPDVALSFIAICRFYFASKDDFLDAFMPHAAVLQSDMKHYTNISPIIQFNTVCLQEPSVG
ncbi:EthD family reductase [Leeia sp. TBRC 13508]|uniref:EthD family reductase n=1 Tax=Leeia speluncae TaxID=2884804 RepID=A0ABS8D9X6_9NEIS|nr:EthD family reductase [Leeia speluncae]MCB6185005.1 EthD family reductase [Leeia speluncae]